MRGAKGPEATRFRNCRGMKNMTREHPWLAVGAFASPWPGNVQVTDDGTGATVATLGGAATLGELTAPLAAGGIWTWDVSHTVELVLYGGHLASRTDDEVLAGANRIAIYGPGHAASGSFSA